MRDEHTHCSCNGVWLCKPCHDWCHAHPFEAKREGLIVSRYALPQEVPAQAHFHLLDLSCDGGFNWNVEEAT